MSMQWDHYDCQLQNTQLIPVHCLVSNTFIRLTILFFQSIFINIFVAQNYSRLITWRSCEKFEPPNLTTGVGGDSLCDPPGLGHRGGTVPFTNCRDSCVQPWRFYSSWIAGKVLWNVAVVHLQNKLISWHCAGKTPNSSVTVEWSLEIAV